MKTQTFEEFLQDAFIRGYSGIKDDCENVFDAWLQNRDVDDMIEFGDMYGRYSYLNGQADLLKEVKHKD